MITRVFSSIDLRLGLSPTSPKPYILFVVIIGFAWFGNFKKAPYIPIAKKRVVGMVKGLWINSNITRVPGRIFTLVYIFVTLAFINFMGLIPYTIPYSSHLSFTIRIGVVLWTRLIIISTTNTKNIKSHHLPPNTPIIIRYFISAVETISSLIRPITLSFRLAANLRAGHVILAIIGTGGALRILKAQLIITPIILLIGVAYLLFEGFVGIIQAYVFTLLRFIYSNDYIN